jgi:3-oxoacyl-[acyl-carrier protein] reductase
VDRRWLDEYRAEVPLGRLGTPGEVADVVAFLASDGARFITGERITVNGGHTID